MRRRGFTLIELVVAMAILLVLIYMAFASFSFVSALSKSNQNREVVLEDMSTVLDQVTKELRQAVTKTSSADFKAVEVPVYPKNAGRGLVDILATGSPQPGLLQQGQYYLFGVASDSPVADRRTILRFYTQGDDGVYRTSYTLGLPLGGGISRAYWPNQSFQPCEVLYGREKWNDTNNDGKVDSGELTAVVSNLPVTGQVITNFTVIRPSWSEKVIQIVIEAMVKDASGKSGKITRMAQVTLRQ